MSDRCQFTELPLGQCAAPCCNQPKSRPAVAPAGPAARPELVAAVTWQDLVDAREPERPGWLKVLSRGQCAGGCAMPYTEGVLIRPDEKTGGWIAECCDPDAERADAIPGGEGPDGADLWARLLAKAAGLGRAA